VLHKCHTGRHRGCVRVTKVSHRASQRLQECYKSVTRGVMDAVHSVGGGVEWASEAMRILIIMLMSKREVLHNLKS
jgi:hypothetical protein